MIGSEAFIFLEMTVLYLVSYLSGCVVNIKYKIELNHLVHEMQVNWI